MTKFYIISIDSLISTFSRVESGIEFDFSIMTENTNIKEQEIAVGDKIIASIEDKVYYSFLVVEVFNDHLKLKKKFEIEKSINYKIGETSSFSELKKEEYENICSKLFSDFNKEIDDINIDDEEIPQEKIYAKIIYAYLKENKSYRAIEDELLQVVNNGYTAMEILRSYDIDINKKNILNVVSFQNEYEVSIGNYRRGLSLLLKYYPVEFVIAQIEFDFEIFHKKTEEAGLIFSEQLIKRFIASLCTKPFVICSGLSGSGKTKLAQAFVQWISESDEQYKIIPVGADWTNREPLLGYPNALEDKKYVKPENGVLDLIIRARDNDKKPFFLILDEMNLSHVERYFADFLSTMESGCNIPLHNIYFEEGEESIDVPRSICLPKNLFIIGTVNIDETTYMFSPKVLDRANTIEFRLSEDNLVNFIESKIQLNMKLLTGEGKDMGEDFVKMTNQKTDKNLESSKEDLKEFFNELKKSGAEFGYRTASEIGRLMFMLETLGEKDDNLLDIAIMQKLLPKLHGSRSKLIKVLPVLGGFCLTKDKDKVKENYLDKFTKNEIGESELRKDSNVKYKISFDKICRMYKNAIDNGFASYAEA